jgi:hypothetical protein
MPVQGAEKCLWKYSKLLNSKEYHVQGHHVMAFLNVRAIH